MKATPHAIGDAGLGGQGGEQVQMERAVGPVDAMLAASGSVAFARFRRDGTLANANPRFLDVVGERGREVTLAELVVEGQRGEAERLLLGDGPPAEPIHLHFASGERAPTTLIVTWARDGDEIILLGEPPVADLEATQTALVRLNSRVSELARENAKKSAQLERALADLQNAQSMLVQREKMAALGQMTAGVAHELNNPLAYVKNNHYLLTQGVGDLLELINLLGAGLDSIEASQPTLFDAIMEKIEAMDLPRLGEKIPELLASVDEGIDRSTRLVQGLRTFSRLDEAETKTIDLNESLRSVVEFLGFLIKETDTTFTADYGELPPVTCSPGQLNQAAMNILTNAVQSCSPGGSVSLTTLADEAEVRILVADSGPGVPEELADRIFDPFFTTRPVGEGTGLGLSIAHTVVAAQGGSITLDDAEGGGAVFIIHLPFAAGGEP
jgi:signal transduction histidine kinase